MTRQPDHTNIQGKIFSTKLRSDSKLLCGFKQFRFEFNIAESMASVVAGGRERIKILCGRKFNCLKSGLGAGSADNKRQVIRRTGCGTQRFHFINEKRLETFWIQERLGFLEKIGLVRRSATFCNK